MSDFSRVRIRTHSNILVVNTFDENGDSNEPAAIYGYNEEDLNKLLFKYLAYIDIERLDTDEIRQVVKFKRIE